MPSPGPDLHSTKALSSLLLCSLILGLADERPSEGVRRQRVRDLQHTAGAAAVGGGGKG